MKLGLLLLLFGLSSLMLSGCLTARAVHQRQTFDTGEAAIVNIEDSIDMILSTVFTQRFHLDDRMIFYSKKFSPSIRLDGKSPKRYRFKKVVILKQGGELKLIYREGVHFTLEPDRVTRNVIQDPRYQHFNGISLESVIKLLKKNNIQLTAMEADGEDGGRLR